MMLRMQDPRQLYGLGSLVKKAIRGVKKIVKSPIGKAALMYAGTAGLGALGGGGFKGLSWLKPSMVMKNWGNAGILGKLKSGKGILGGFGNIFRQGGDPTKGFSVGRMLAGGLGATALAAPFMMGGDEEEEEEESWTNVPSSIADIRNQAKNYYTLGSAGSNLNFMPQKQFVDANYYAADGGRVGLLNGGEAGQEQIEQMLMAEYIKYKNQGGQLTFEQFVQAVMQQQEGGMEQPQELPQEGEVIYAADGGRIGYAGGQLVRPSADGSRPGYSGIMEGIIAAFGKGMDKSIPKRKKDEDLTRDEAERIKMAVFEVLDQTAGGEKSTLSGTFIDNLGDSLEQFVRPDLSAYIKDYTQGTGIFAKDFIFGGKDDILKKAHGGRIGYNRGRVVNPGGYAGEEEGNIQLLWEAIKKQFDPAHWVDMFNFFSGKSGEINSSGFPPNLEIGEGFGSEALLPEDLKAHGGRIGLLSGGLLDDDEDETTYNPYAATKMYRRMGKQEGGIMESEAAEEMINMNGQEKDYRETGGFVNLGGKERADDVPARLSKNEFVFTADAVRAAGGGDIDAGSEVMQNMMDNLEQGGEISEESQGLEGAQAMYDQQQMLQSRIA